MSEIMKILLNNKPAIFLEDTSKYDKDEIRRSNVILSKYFVCLNGNDDVIVISNKSNKEHVFQEALNANTLINFEPLGKIKNTDFDPKLFKNKIVIFYKCFEGMTSSENKTYKNIKEIIKVARKYIGIDTIGEKYLQPFYFNSTLRLLGENEVNPMIRRELNNSLVECLNVIHNDELITKIEKNYWADTWIDEIDDKFYDDFGTKYKVEEEISSIINEKNDFFNQSVNVNRNNTLKTSDYDFDNASYFTDVGYKSHSDKNILDEEVDPGQGGWQFSKNSELSREVTKNYDESLTTLDYNFDKDSYFVDDNLCQIEDKISVDEDLNHDAKSISVEINDAIIDILLCMLGFIGIAGVHHFYRKKYLFGILYLITLGFWWIGTIFDIIKLMIRLIEIRRKSYH